jgi:release factor-specific protein-(glutamine-N5) methyltransferase
MDKCKQNTKKYCNIGGQAVMEGVMMMGKNSLAIAVRDSNGVIRLETKRLKEKKSLFYKIPVIRGVLNFVFTMVTGINTLMRSADVYGEGEPSKFEKWLSEKFKINIMTVVTAFSLVLGLGLAVALFILLPTFLSDIIYSLFNLSKSSSPAFYSVLAGFFKVLILICYLLLVSLIKDVKRTFMYHGAEHKTINCYESGKELTVENVQKFSTLHNRCGTTFLFYVIFVSIIVFIVLQAISGVLIIDNYLLQVGVRVLIIPLVAGLAYEMLKFLARHDSLLFYPFKLPGLALQKITTKQPDDGMVEVAIMAFNAVLSMENDKTISEVKFDSFRKIEDVYDEIRSIFKKSGSGEEADIDWIFSYVLCVSRSGIKTKKVIKNEEYGKIIALAKQRAEGRPLQYILGETEFYGFKIRVNESVLIPRFDTEAVAEKAVSLINKDSSVLDLCTGSGCIAIAVQKKTGCKVTAADISGEALAVAKQNADENAAEIEFIQSDMFGSLKDRKFDIIICNPPYIRTGDIEKLDAVVKDYEPKVALDGGTDGLYYYKILAKQAQEHLNEGGAIVLEIGDGTAQEVKEVFSGYKYININIYKDLSGNDRIMTAYKG